MIACGSLSQKDLKAKTKLKPTLPLYQTKEEEEEQIHPLLSTKKKKEEIKVLQLTTSVCACSI